MFLFPLYAHKKASKKMLREKRKSNGMFGAFSVISEIERVRARMAFMEIQFIPRHIMMFSFNF